MALRRRKFKVMEPRAFPKRHAKWPIRYACSEHGWVSDTAFVAISVRCPCGRLAEEVKS